MEYIAEAMHASIDLTRTASHENVDLVPTSRPSSSSSSSTSPVSAATYQHHPGLDTSLTIFYRPVYPSNLDQHQQPIGLSTPTQYPVSSMVSLLMLLLSYLTVLSG